MKVRLLIFIYLIFNFTLINAQCLPDGIRFLTQSQIDSFPSNYQGCSKVLGYVSISTGYNVEDVILNVDSLFNIDTIMGSLIISGNTYLESISGLSNLKTIGGSLSIGENDSLKNFSGLNSLTTIGWGFQVISNNSLLNFEGLDKLSKIIGNFRVSGNDSLKNFIGLDSLKNLTHPFIVLENFSLVDFEGLNITEAGKIDIRSNPNLENFNGLDSLTKIKFHFWVRYNNDLKSFTGLENVESIGGDLWITRNPLLEELTSLLNVNSINGELNIDTNFELTSLEGLKNIDSESIQDLYIVDNPFLSICNVQSICEYLENPNGETLIIDNNIGCNNIEEVENECLVSVVNKLSINDLCIYPSPFTSSTNISYHLNEPSSVHLSIFNHLGSQVYSIQQYQQEGENNFIWNASQQASGYYFFKLMAGDKIYSGKMIKIN